CAPLHECGTCGDKHIFWKTEVKSWREERDRGIGLNRLMKWTLAGDASSARLPVAGTPAGQNEQLICRRANQGVEAQPQGTFYTRLINPDANRMDWGS